MKLAEDASGQVMAVRLAQALAPQLSLIESAVKKDAGRALEAVEVVLKAAEEAPARLVAAAIAAILAFSIGFVELVIKLFG